MIYSKTPKGQAALHGHQSGLSPRQRSALIMFDGKKSDAEVLRLTSSFGVVPADLERLLADGFLQGGAGQSALPIARAEAQATYLPEPAVEAEPRTEQARYSLALPIATRLTAGLGLRGFRLNLAVEAAGDWTKLNQLAPKIKDAVGAEKFRELEAALKP
jgi:hypothetical protein